MSTPSSTAFTPLTASAPTSLLRELFQATPLYIFAAALKAAMQKPVAR